MRHGDRHGDIDTLGARHVDPERVGPCRIEARLSVGPSSIVYRAVDTELSRTVVVKLLTASHETDEAEVQRFLLASQALLGVVAPHLASVLRAGLHAEVPYVVYEYLDGEDLDRAVRRERALVPAAALRAVLDTAEGLGAAAARGVTHGDVRPRHLIRTRGATKVTGVGLSPLRRTAQGRTLPGHPAYLAPELAQGVRQPDMRSDIYALGCTLFELVTGRTPFAGGGPDALIASHAHEPFPSVQSVDAHLPAELDELIAGMVAKQPVRRFADYVELLQAGAALLPALRTQRAEDPVLVVEEGRQEGLRVPVPEGELLLGRTPDEGMQIDDGRCSRRHAMVRRSGDYLEVEDLGSRNGIRVNGVEVASRQLFPGDRIEIGDTVLRLEGPAPAVPQLPALGVPAMQLPASPLRGAFGDVEIAHPPRAQLTPEGMADPKGPGAGERLRVLARLAPLLAMRHERPLEMQREVLTIVGDAVGAQDRVLVKVEGGQPVFEAKSSHEAQLLSCVLPALERALPGQLALATSVRVGADDRWPVMLAPLLRDSETIAYLVLVKREGAFDEAALGVLEGSCALLSLRASAPPMPQPR